MSERREATVKSELMGALVNEERARGKGSQRLEPLAPQATEGLLAMNSPGSRPCDSPVVASAQLAPQAPSAEQRAEAIAAMVERITLAQKDGQPNLTLDWSATGKPGSVSITRTGKGEVAIRIRGGDRKGAQELREKLTARGLRVRSLDID